MLNSKTVKKMQDLYLISKKTAVGAMVVCPSCKKEFEKKTYQQGFCSGKCKDWYWNNTVPERACKKNAFYNSRKVGFISSLEEDDLEGALTCGDEDVCADFSNQYN
jgi:endogenous inhibitor of DNA gyrase (YacG/DUF329 family)